MASNGSIYDTVFWKHAKDVWNKHDKVNIEKIIKIVKGMSETDVEKSRSNIKIPYAQWQEWNFDNWIKGTI